MNRIKNIVFILVISGLITWLCDALKSVTFAAILKDKILEILITLLAINTATISVVITKIHEISQTEGKPFNDTIKEVKISLIEQIVLIVFAIIVLITYNSPIIKEGFKFHEFFFNTLFTAIFIYAVDILRDTGMAIFEIIKHPKRPK